MKAIRTYQITDGVLIQASLLSALFDVENDSLDDPSRVIISAAVDPDGVLVPEHRDVKLSVSGDTSLDVLLDELQHFINVLKTMYYGS